MCESKSLDRQTHPFEKDANNVEAGQDRVPYSSTPAVSPVVIKKKNSKKSAQGRVYTVRV